MYIRILILFGYSFVLMMYNDEDNHIERKILVANNWQNGDFLFFQSDFFGPIILISVGVIISAYVSFKQLLIFSKMIYTVHLIKEGLSLI